MQTFYFTFGFNTNLKGCYMKVEAKGPHEAREHLMAVLGGPRWAFQYNERTFDGQIDRYGLREVPTTTPLELTSKG